MLTLFLSTINRERQVHQATTPDLKNCMLIAASCLLLLTLAYWLSRPAIEQNQNDAALSLIRDIAPEAKQVSLKNLQELHTKKMSHLSCNSWLILTEARGYSGILKVISAVSIHENTIELNAVRVVPPHQETPGIGDVIEPQYSNWISQFNKVIVPKIHPDQTVKFDSISGATLSTEAVIRASAAALVTASKLAYEDSKDDCGI